MPFFSAIHTHTFLQSVLIFLKFNTLSRCFYTSREQKLSPVSFFIFPLAPHSSKDSDSALLGPLWKPKIILSDVKKKKIRIKNIRSEHRKTVRHLLCPSFSFFLFLSLPLHCAELTKDGTGSRDNSRQFRAVCEVCAPKLLLPAPFDAPAYRNVLNCLKNSRLACRLTLLPLPPRRAHIANLVRVRPPENGLLNYSAPTVSAVPTAPTRDTFQFRKKRGAMEARFNARIKGSRSLTSSLHLTMIIAPSFLFWSSAFLLARCLSLLFCITQLNKTFDSSAARLSPFPPNLKAESRACTFAKMTSRKSSFLLHGMHGTALH